MPKPEKPHKADKTDKQDIPDKCLDTRCERAAAEQVGAPGEMGEKNLFGCVC